MKHQIKYNLNYTEIFETFFYKLIKLCIDKTLLLKLIISYFGHYISSIDYSQINLFIPQIKKAFSNWKIDLGSVNWLSFFLAHKILPQQIPSKNW